MFLENDYVEPLFSLNGGPPKAFRCKVIIGAHECGITTKTEKGMRSHLITVHKWEEQPCLYSTDNQSDQNKGRKLRAGPPLLKSPEKQDEVSTEKNETPKSTETKGEELLRLTSPENLPSRTSATSFNFAIATEEEDKPIQDTDTHTTERS